VTLLYVPSSTVLALWEKLIDASGVTFSMMSSRTSLCV
jgi:hypothetical protein